MATFEQFLEIDIRVGRVVRVEDFPEARRPAWKLWLDFGPEIGERSSSAQISNYGRAELPDATDENGDVILLEPEAEVPPGARVH